MELYKHGKIVSMGMMLEDRELSWNAKGYLCYLTNRRHWTRKQLVDLVAEEDLRINGYKIVRG